MFGLILEVKLYTSELSNRVAAYTDMTSLMHGKMHCKVHANFNLLPCGRHVQPVTVAREPVAGCLLKNRH